MWDRLLIALFHVSCSSCLGAQASVLYAILARTSFVWVLGKGFGITAGANSEEVEGTGTGIEGGEVNIFRQLAKGPQEQ